MSHTYAVLEVSHEAFAEIKAKLEAAGYSDQIYEDRNGGLLIDMHGLAIKDAGKSKTRDGYLPCPYCGWHIAEVTSEGESSPNAYFVQCARCHACGPAAGVAQYDRTRDTAERQKAINAWNKRTA